jgi:Protein of unknown function (DUF3048) N-terminal domain/Protein of unknown function (DUF3048) C-terminal domain
MKRFIGLIMVALLSSCSFVSGGEQSQPEIERNVLTGLPGSNGKVLAVKFDDTVYAHPQEGIEYADVVFVTQVEAGLTRVMGIYSSNYPEILGPVRSARISDIDILAQFGKVGFLYSGSQSKLRPVLSASNIVNLSAERNPPSIYFNDPERTAPYAMMVKPNLLLEKASEVELVKTVGWKHGVRATTAKKILSATIRWPNAVYKATWSKSEQRFVLDHDKKANLAASGEQLGSPMMVIQIATIRPSEYGDKFGGVTPKTTVTGTGTGYLLRNGSVTKAIWERATPEAPTTWTLEDGTDAFFQRGQVWIFLTDQEPEFEFAPIKAQK